MYISQKLQIRPNNVQKTVIEHYFALYRKLYNSMAKVINKRLAYNKFVAFSKYEAYFKEKYNSPEMRYLRKYGQEFYDQIIKNISRSYSALKTSSTGEEKSIRLKENLNYGKVMIGGKEISIVYKRNAKYPYLKIKNFPSPIRLNKPIRFKGALLRIHFHRTGDRYFVTLCFSITSKEYKSTHKHLFTKTNKYIGVDVGIVNNVALSNGLSLNFYQRIEHIKRKIRVLSQKVSEIRNYLEKKGLTTSNKLKKYQRMLTRAHLIKSLIIKDSLNKLTTNLVRHYDAICIEDLSIEQFMKKSSIAKVFGSLAFGEFKKQLLQKCNEENYKKLVLANRYYPSTQKCSQCDTTNVLNDLTIRNYTCKACGLEIDRDLNAAINLYKYMISILGLVRSDVKAEKVVNLGKIFAKQGFFVKNLSTQGSG